MLVDNLATEQPRCSLPRHGWRVPRQAKDPNRLDKRFIIPYVVLLEGPGRKACLISKIVKVHATRRRRVGEQNRNNLSTGIRTLGKHETNRILLI